MKTIHKLILIFVMLILINTETGVADNTGTLSVTAIPGIEGISTDGVMHIGGSLTANIIAGSNTVAFADAPGYITPSKKIVNDYKAAINSPDDMVGGTYNSITIDITDSTNKPVEDATVDTQLIIGESNITKMTDSNGRVIITFVASHCGAGGCPMYVTVVASKTVNGIVHMAHATKTVNLHNPEWQIDVIAPSGGEIWQTGSTQAIKWDYRGNPSSTKIELFKNGVLNQVITPDAPVGTDTGNINHGIYNWKIPIGLNAGSNYSIRVSNDLLWAVADGNYFSIKTAPISIGLTITPPPNIIQVAMGVKTKVNIGIATITGGISPVAIVNNAPTDGFPVGQTIVTWIATDSIGETAKDTQLITIMPQTNTIVATRTIGKTTLTAGSEIDITVAIQNGATQAFSLKEAIPPGWTLTRVTDDADQFKEITNEWIWFAVTANTVKTVKYKVTVPLDTAPGMYNINGYVVSNGIMTSVSGDNTITVIQGDILVCYRSLGQYPNIVETSDLLKAADDWRNDAISPCFPAIITTNQLLALADEWRNS